MNGSGQISISNFGDIEASGYGVRAVSTEQAGINLYNIGSVKGAQGAILTSGGTSMAITNVGNAWITGGVALGLSGLMQFDNQGTWSAVGPSYLGDGTSILTNTGMVVLGGFAGPGDTLTINSLEFWNNSGSVVFGGGEETLTDGVANDRIASAGTLFTGSGASTLVMDVDFTADQADCSAAVTADCFDLRNSTTAGSTKIRVNAVGGGMPTANRIVLVDVSGSGTSAAEHFALDPLSSGYRELPVGGALDQGMYFYGLKYDATAQQHYLAPIAFGSGVTEIPQIARAASEPWRTATGAWRERQRDMRAAWDDQRAAGPSFWLKGARNIIDDERRQTVTVGDLAFDDHIASHQNTDAIIGGLDLLHMTGDNSAFVAGVTAGKLKSNFDHKITGSELELDGHSFGAYATFMSGSLMADVIANATNLDLSRSQMNQRSEGSAKSLGIQAEGGWRLLQSDDGGAYIEPIAALTYVKTEVDDLTIGTTTATFADAKSLRGAIGARAGGKMDVGPVTLALTATGRVWKEFEGENEATLQAVF
ncbi:MAG: autotransporter domain-containing protein, partial [Parcubacteria group bacterium]